MTSRNASANYKLVTHIQPETLTLFHHLSCPRSEKRWVIAPSCFVPFFLRGVLAHFLQFLWFRRWLAAFATTVEDKLISVGANSRLVKSLVFFSKTVNYSLRSQPSWFVFILLDAFLKCYFRSATAQSTWKIWVTNPRNTKNQKFQLVMFKLSPGK